MTSRRRLLRAEALGALTVLLSLGACSSDGGETTAAPPPPTAASSPSEVAGPPAKGGSAEELATLLSDGIEFDYEPLASPEAAVEGSDVVIAGRVREVIWEVSVDDEDSVGGVHPAQSYALLVVETERMVSPALSGREPGVVHVAVPRSGITDGAPAPAVGGIDLVAVLDGPAPLGQDGRAVRAPAGTDEETQVYGTPVDGLFLQGPADAEMLGVHSTRGELRSSWGRPVTLADYEATLTEAAR